MADRFLDSASATPTAPYETAGTAATTLATLTALALAVDEDIWVRPTHAESTATAVTFNAPAAATRAAPQRLICVSDFLTGTPPNTVSTGAAISTTGASNITFNGFWYAYGMTFNAGSAANNANVVLGNSAYPVNQVFNSCTFNIATTAATGLNIGQEASTLDDDTRVELNNCSVKFGATSQRIYLRHGVFYINGLSIDATGSAPTSLFARNASYTGHALVENSDLSGKAWSSLFNVANAANHLLAVRNCKFPAAWSAYTGTILPGTEIRIDNCSSGSDNYTNEFHVAEGSVFVDTGKYATTNPASDGTTSYSWRMVSAAACSKWTPLKSDWIHVWVDSTATAITPAMELLVGADGAAALNDDDVWIEVDAMTTASTPLATRVTDAAATILTTGTAQAAGTTAWTGDGYVTERTHKIALGSSITPSQKGYIRCRAVLAKPSTTIYVNPRVAL